MCDVWEFIVYRRSCSLLCVCFFFSIIEQQQRQKMKQLKQTSCQINEIKGIETDAKKEKNNSILWIVSNAIPCINLISFKLCIWFHSNNNQPLIYFDKMLF